MNKHRRPRSVFVVDDSEAFLDAASEWIATIADLRLVGTASSGLDALDRLSRLDPDVIIMDAGMPVIDGFEATRRLKQSPQRRRVVMISFQDTPEVRREAREAGADAFLPKGEFTRALGPTVRSLT
jgi:CheY-like chemotaxis protein